MEFLKTQLQNGSKVLSSSFCGTLWTYGIEFPWFDCLACSYVLIWPRMVFLLLFTAMAMCGLIRLCIVLYNLVWSFMVFMAFLWSYRAFYGFLWQNVVFSHSFGLVCPKIGLFQDKQKWKWIVHRWCMEIIRSPLMIMLVRYLYQVFFIINTIIGTRKSIITIIRSTFYLSFLDVYLMCYYLQMLDIKCNI